MLLWLVLQADASKVSWWWKWINHGVKAATFKNNTFFRKKHEGSTFQPSTLKMTAKILMIKTVFLTFSVGLARIELCLGLNLLLNVVTSAGILRQRKPISSDRFKAFNIYKRHINKTSNSKTFVIMSTILSLWFL